MVFQEAVGVGSLPPRATGHQGVVVAEAKPLRHGLESIRDDVQGPDRVLAERLRELYRISGWSSLKDFARAIAAQRTEAAPTTGTLSRYLSGDRWPTEEFLGQMFSALDADMPGDAQLTEELKDSTRQMYFECIRKTQPARYKAFEAEQLYGQAASEYEQSRKLVEELHDELQRARLERDELDAQLKQLGGVNSRVTKDRNQLKWQIAQQQAALDAKIAELNEELRRAKEERDQARKERDNLVAGMHAAARAAAGERQALVEQHQEQLHQSETLLSEALERQRVAEEQLETVRKALGTSDVDEPFAGSVTSIEPVERLIQAQIRLLNGPEADEQCAAVDDMRRLMREHPAAQAQIVDVLCQFVRRPRAAGNPSHRAATGAVQAIAEQLRAGFVGPVDLSGADLSGAYLDSCTLRNARLRGVTLRRASLRDTDLAGADLTGADLLGADLRGARLASTDLQGVTNVTAADLEHTLDTKTMLLPDNLVRSRRLLRAVVTDRPGSVTEERSMGLLLRQARERSGLSLPDLSTRTRLDLPLLQAMEEGDPSSYRTLELLTSVVRAVGADTRQIAKFWEALQDRRFALAIREPRVHVTLQAAPALREGHRPRLTGSPEAKTNLEQARSSEMDALRAGQSREQERRQALRTPAPEAAARELEQQETARSAAAAQAYAAVRAREAAAATSVPDPDRPDSLSGPYGAYQLAAQHPSAQYQYDPYPYEPQPYPVDPYETDPYGYGYNPSTPYPDDGSTEPSTGA
jgi:uncharacterized protein YjbI with pentapeptide repeats